MKIILILLIVSFINMELDKNKNMFLRRSFHLIRKKVQIILIRFGSWGVYMYYIQKVGYEWVAGVLVEKDLKLGGGRDENSGREFVDRRGWGSGDKKIPMFKPPFVLVSASTNYFTPFDKGCTFSAKYMRLFSDCIFFYFIVKS